MPADYHKPVLVQEVCAALVPPLRAAVTAGRQAIFVDCTCGGGGHTEALLLALAGEMAEISDIPAGTPPPRFLALDRDPEALAHARLRLPDVEFIHTPFSQLGRVLDEAGVSTATAILADLGVSSHQLDTAGRGFSFQTDAALDMRMDQGQGPTLAELLATMDEQSLTRILRELGEEPDAGRIARGIVAARPRTTLALGEVVRASMSAPRLRQIGLRIHPATRTFQALRIHLNRELQELDQLLIDAPARLAVGGRLGVISFHSLEDRRAKQRFAGLSRAESLPAGIPILAADLPRARFTIPDPFRHGATPAEPELAHNPRSRSSRLRVLERVLP